MSAHDPYEEIARLKGFIDQVMLETVRSGNDVSALVNDLRVILQRAQHENG